MHLYDSGTKEQGQFFVFNFVGAGQYPVICLIHQTMTMTVKVPMKAAPSTGTQTTVFTITWASAAPPSGYAFDVQIKRPGSTMFFDWTPYVGTTVRTATFTADTGTGVYSFQARLRKLSDRTASNYSAPVSITVNP